MWHHRLLQHLVEDYFKALGILSDYLMCETRTKIIYMFLKLKKTRMQLSCDTQNYNESDVSLRFAHYNTASIFPQETFLTRSPFASCLLGSETPGARFFNNKSRRMGERLQVRCCPVSLMWLWMTTWTWIGLCGFLKWIACPLESIWWNAHGWACASARRDCWMLAITPFCHLAGK